MAYPDDNGDISYIKPLGKIQLPGGGHTLTGAYTPKVLVWGELKGNWADTTGLKLSARGSAAALGLTRIDFITFEPKVTGTDASKTYEVDLGLHQVTYDHGDNYIHVCIDGNANPTAGDDITLGFIAVGDDASAPELT